MQTLQIISNPEVQRIFDHYPDSVQARLLNLRKLIIDTAKETEEVKDLEETLKWGEPSYLSKHGSTIRIDWKKNKPEQYAMYFKCTSKLVATFQSVYGDLFRFEGTRAILFHMDDDIPDIELKTCIRVALIYHKVKHLPLLGL